jgi:hypothetical protein
MLPEEKVSKVKSDFLSAYYKKIEKVLDEYKRKLFRELSPLFDSNTRSLAIEIGEKIFDIKSYFFKSYAKVNELETEFKQKNNLLMLEIELRSYLFFKYKESLEGIRKLLSTKPFSLVSFIPLFLQISPTSENYLSPQDYMVFALIMNKNLENEPFKETSDYINHELKFDTNYISSALERMKENKLIFNLDKNGTNRLYINAPKIIRLKEEYYPADVL